MKNVHETSKGKEVSGPYTGEGPSKKAIPIEKAEEFMSIIKKSDYKVVDHLNQTTSKISMLSLLLSFQVSHPRKCTSYRTTADVELIAKLTEAPLNFIYPTKGKWKYQ